MKTLTLSLFLFCVFASCNKDQNQANSIAASISYKVNGNLVTIENVDIASAQYVLFAKQLGSPGSTRYLFNGQKGLNHVFVFYILTDSLQKKTYHLDSTLAGTALNYNGQASALIYKNDFIDITITDYSNSHVSGTFTGKLSPLTGAQGSTIITEGKLTNVQVIY